MIALALFIAACASARCIAPVVAGLAATVLAIVIIGRCNAVRRSLLALGSHDAKPADWDACASSCRRRLADRGLRWSLRRTELKSLLPLIDARAERIVDALKI